MSSQNIVRTKRQRTRKPRGNNQLVVAHPASIMDATNAPLAQFLLNQNKPKRRRVRNRRAQQPRRKEALNRLVNRPTISMCALKYASALLDPENTPVGACVPWGFPANTFKAKGFSAGRMACGTSGVGFFGLTPVATNDTGATLATSSTSVGTTGTALNAFTNTIPGLAANLPVSIAQYTAQSLSSRCVSAIAKVRYAGTEAGRNGTIYCFEHPDHLTCDTMTPQQILQSTQRTDERPRMDGSWHSVLWSGPVVGAEAELAARPGSQARGNVIDPMVIIIQGSPGDIYDVEFYFQIEYHGPNMQGSGPAESDPSGYSDVIASLKNAVQGSPIVSDMGPSLFRQILSDTGNSLKSMIAHYGADAVKAGISSFLTGRNSNRLLTEL